jgi:L-ascorbate oxidase
MHLGSRFPILFVFVFVALLGAVQANTECHDETFVPDAILRITQANITQSCLPPKLVVLVNGTSPGPELRLKAGQTYWIRVYMIWSIGIILWFVCSPQPSAHAMRL